MRNNRVLVASLLLLLCSAGCSGRKEVDSQTKIHQGTLVKLTDLAAKHTVAIVSPDAPLVPICTGSLIAKNLVLTAAHCVYRSSMSKEQTPTNVSVGLGFVEDESVATYSTEIIVHPKFGEVQNTYLLQDLAILRLHETQPFPIALEPVALGDASEVSRGSEVTIAGYGDLGFDEKGQIISNLPAQLMAAQTRIYALASKRKNMITYESDNKLSGACHRDSGGPMFMHDLASKGLKLIGATSGTLAFDALSKKCIGSGVYTNVTEHLDWIIPIIEAEGLNSVD